MSFYNVPMDDYQMPPAGTPGWQFAPVPGWGTNPDRAGPLRVGVGAMYSSGIVPTNQAVLPRYAPLDGCGCRPMGELESEGYRETTYGHVALAAAGGIAVGILFGFAWWRGPKR